MDNNNSNNNNNWSKEDFIRYCKTFMRNIDNRICAARVILDKVKHHDPNLTDLLAVSIDDEENAAKYLRSKGIDSDNG